MAAKDWVEVAQVTTSIVAACGLVLTACGLGATAWQMRRARMTADLQALQKFFDNTIEREAALIAVRGKSEGERQFAFNEFLSFLELYAFAHNRNLFGASSESLVRHKLADSFNVLNQMKEWHTQIEEAIDTSTTMIEFSKFRERHRNEIEQRAEERRRKQRTKLAVS
jgi:hypothetical protein